MAGMPLTRELAILILFTFLQYASAAFEDLHFTRQIYNLTIPENAVGKTQAISTEKMGIFVSNSNLVLRYKIMSGDPLRIFKAESRLVGDFWLLVIRVRTGNRNALNREYQDIYRLIVRATVTSNSRSHVKIKAQTEAAVHVTDTNDITPFFYPQKHYEITVAEDAPLHCSLLQVSAFDPDLGINSEVYYSLTEFTLQFAVHPTRGIITLTRPLDYQTKALHELTIVAEDRGVKFRAADITLNSATVRVKVTPVNIHPPEIFIHKFSSVLTPAPPNVYAIVTVHDKDHGVNGKIGDLAIVGGNTEGLFRVVQGLKPNEFNIELDRSLSRHDHQESYSLTLRVTDEGVPPKSTTQELTIQIAEKNAPVPVFTQTDYDIEIEEVSPPGSRILQLETTLPGLTEIAFRIENGNANETFTINSKSGLLFTQKHLDKELQAYYSLTVSASNAAFRGMTQKSSAIVNIRVLDCNDNNPAFNMSSDIVIFDENKPAGSVVYTAFAVDKDQDDNGFITYSLANLNKVPFTVDPFTGEIRSTEVLDYETMRRDYVLKIRASDWGTPFRRQTEMSLKISLRDVNDHRPLFEKVGCTGYVSEWAPIHTEVVTLSALDFDVGSHVTYRMIPSNDDPCFRLDTIKGILKVNCNLSKKGIKEKILNVSATDGSHFADVMSINLKIISSRENHKLSDKWTLVQCMDVGVTERFKKQLSTGKANNQHNDATEPLHVTYGGNRYSPEFPSSLPTEVWVNESLAVGSEIVSLKAKDKDRGYSGHLVYIISNGDDYCFFKISLYTGLLTVAKPLDRENKPKYELNITSFDLGQPQYSVSRVLVIHVNDMNDNYPVFEKNTYEFVITENVINGTSIVRLLATDEDEGLNSALTYSLETDLDEFSIDSTSGLLIVCGPVDREITDYYNIKVRVSDNSVDNMLSSTTEVKIRVLDVNDNEPAFSLSQYFVKVREDLPVGSVIIVMSARDPDLAGGGIVTYEIKRDQEHIPFTIDKLMGVVRLSSPLDFESQQVYDLVIAARDSGVPSLTSETTLVVEVEDVNENMFAPVFEDVVFIGDVKENQPEGTVVLKLTATDADGPGINGQVVYSIRGGDGVGFFDIDDKGIIRTTEVLDRETNHHYWLIVYAMDRGAVPLSSHVDVYIAVVDENDNVPLTTEPAYYPTVPENAPEGTAVVQLVASDMDSDQNLPLHFSIVSGDPQRFFSINNRTGFIVTSASSLLDREVQSEHAFEVQVQDSGNPPLSSLTRVVVKVTDVNDNDPKFMLGFYHCPVLESNSAKNDTILCLVLASDADEGDNGKVIYSLEAGEESETFWIDSITGAIYSLEKLHAGENHVFMVRAKDNGIPERSSTVRVSIEVLPLPRNGMNMPYFEDGDYKIAVAENDKVGFNIAFLKATDLDGDRLWYYIVDGNIHNSFIVQPNNGILMIAQPLNWADKSEYKLNVSVTDGIYVVYQQVCILLIAELLFLLVIIIIYLA